MISARADFTNVFHLTHFLRGSRFTITANRTANQSGSKKPRKTTEQGGEIQFARQQI
jgi:hypothetical protein